MRRVARTDANQGRVVRYLRSIGARVAVTSQLGGGFPDLVVLIRGRVLLLEVKDGPGQKLTPAEETFHTLWVDGPLYIVTSEEDCERAIEEATK